MQLPKFELHEPVDVGEACRILSAQGGAAKPLAGGTDLLVNMKHRQRSPAHLVSLSKILKLKRMEMEQGMIRIGAGVTVAELMESALILERLSALSAGAAVLGSLQIRNLATIGGNIASARSTADLPPALLAYGADIVLRSTKGQRKMLLSDFFTGAGLTARKPDEIITEFQVPIPPPTAGAGFLNLGVRNAQDLDIVNVAAYIALGNNGAIQTARVVMGCVGATHLLSVAAANILAGAKPGPALFQKAAEAAQKECAPIDDFRATAEYRRAMIGVLTRRALEAALKEARKPM